LVGKDFLLVHCTYQILLLDIKLKEKKVLFKISNPIMPKSVFLLSEKMEIIFVARDVLKKTEIMHKASLSDSL
jgi:hypothetical protein